LHRAARVTLQQGAGLTAVEAADDEAWSGVLELSLHLLGQLAGRRQDDATGGPPTPWRVLSIFLLIDSGVKRKIQHKAWFVVTASKLATESKSSPPASNSTPGTAIKNDTAGTFGPYLQQVLNDWQGKGKCLARASPGATNEVAAGSGWLEDMFLDGE
jgi:hypothetical protein